MDQDEIKTIILATGVFQNKKRELLLVKRSSKNTNFINFWQLPEGVIELKEQPKYTLKREVYEELKCQTKNLNLALTINTYVNLDNKRFQLFRIVFKGTISGSIKLSHEHSEYRWIPYDQVNKIKDLVPGTSTIIKQLNL